MRKACNALKNMVPPAGIESRTLRDLGNLEYLPMDRDMVPPAGIEPATPGLGNLCSILLS
jgi:hypothetical protein